MPILTLFKEKPRKKGSRRRYLIGQLDKITSERVRKRDGYICRKCGRDQVGNHHIFGKAAHPATRWELDNGLSLCFFCHRDAHASPEDFRRWVLSWMGEAAYEALYVKAQMRTSFKEVDLEWMLKELRGGLKCASHG